MVVGVDSTLVVDDTFVGAGFDCFSASMEERGSLVVLVRSVGFFRWFGGLFNAGSGSDGCDVDAAAFDLLVGLTFRSFLVLGIEVGVRSRLYSPVCAAVNTMETVDEDEVLWRFCNTDGTPLLVGGIQKAITPLLPPLATRIVMIPTATALAATIKTGLLLRIIIIIIIILGCRCQTNIIY